MPSDTPSFRPAGDQLFPELSPGSYMPPQRPARPAAAGARPAPPAALAAFAGALDRLEEAIDQETAELAAHRPVDLEDFNRRKSHSLLELTRMTRALPADGARAFRDRLDTLRDKLARNQSLLALHLSAVQEIAELIVGAMGEVESDGTYGSVPNSWDLAR